MSTNPRQPPQGDSPGLLSGLIGIVRRVCALLVTRIELVALELSEVRDNLARLFLVGVIGLVALMFALGCWTALVIVLAWDAMGWTVLMLVGALYTLAAIGALVYARNMIASGKLSMPATMTELRNDRDALL